MAAKFDQAKFDKQVMGMHPLYRGFVFYAKYHWDAVNQWIHIACVWPILFTSIVLFSYIQLPDAVTSLIPAWAASSTFPVDVNNVGFVLGCCYLVWHFYLDISIGLVANVLVVACLLASTAIHRNKEIAGDAYMYAWAVHIFCWIAQFYGHGVHEQRRPALFENLFASAFMAPIFVVIEVLCKAGLMPEFMAKLTTIVQPEVDHYRSSLGGKGKSE